MITVIIMTVIAGTIIISINNTKIIDKTSEVAAKQNLAAEKERLDTIKKDIAKLNNGKVTKQEYLNKLVEKGITEE